MRTWETLFLWEVGRFFEMAKISRVFKAWKSQGIRDSR